MSIHQRLCVPPNVPKESVLEVQGPYEYFHYGCNGLDDRGWGCGYRTLQTLCSWVRNTQNKQGSMTVPIIPDIQTTLADMGDKPPSFQGSKQWIGSVEVALVIDQLYGVPCKILHIHAGQLNAHMEEIKVHFQTKGSPIMMGGDSDASSKGIIGVCWNEDQHYLLVLDPHYYGPEPTQQTLIEAHMLEWRNINEFCQNSFYNLCLPQLKSR